MDKFHQQQARMDLAHAVHWLKKIAREGDEYPTLTLARIRWAREWIVRARYHLNRVR